MARFSHAHALHLAPELLLPLRSTMPCAVNVRVLLFPSQMAGTCGPSIPHVNPKLSCEIGSDELVEV